MRQMLKFLFLIVLMISVPAAGQQVRDSIVSKEEKESMKRNREWLRRDIREYEQYNNQLKEFEAAWIDKNFGEVQRLKDTLVSYMKREIDQNEKKAEKELKELGKSRSDLMFEKDAGTYDRKDAIRPGHELEEKKEEKRELKVETRNVRGDRQDVRDDRLDLQTRRNIVDRQIEILSLTAPYLFTRPKASDPEAMDVRELIAEFAYTMQRDIEMTRKEFDENKSEYPEERKEVNPEEDNP